MSPPLRKRKVLLGGLALFVAAGAAAFFRPEPEAPSPLAGNARHAAQGLPALSPPEPAAPADAARSEIAAPAPRRRPAADSPAAPHPPATAAARRDPSAAPAAGRRDLLIEVHPATASAYRAMQRGELAVAREHYQQALGNDPRSRDALVGLAATAWREGRSEEAARRYEQLLALDPRDAEANAGMALLRGALDPSGHESRLKNLLEERGDNAALHHALGSLLASQHRWGEAREAFAGAAALAPQAADYRFNLAVSLEHLGHYARAGMAYRQALALAAAGSATFDRDAAQARLAAIDGLRP